MPTINALKSWREDVDTRHSEVNLVIEPVEGLPSTGSNLPHLEALRVNERPSLDSTNAVFLDAPTNEEQPDDSEVFRGGGHHHPSPILLPRAHYITAETRSTTSSSSSSSINVGRRIGAIASAVETAIARWARTHSSSGSTTSSSSSAPSSTTRTHTTRRRRGRRYSSAASFHNAVYERALYERKKAQLEFRVCSREFTLFVPKDLSTVLSRTGKRSNAIGFTDHNTEKEQRLLQTTSLSEIMSKLDMALKHSSKARKQQERVNSSVLPEGDPRKGKNKARISEHSGLGHYAGSVPRNAGEVRTQRAWWLDVASPTWEDLRSIGKVMWIPKTSQKVLADSACSSFISIRSLWKIYCTRRPARSWSFFLASVITL
jgi:magnesium transporter